MSNDSPRQFKVCKTCKESKDIEAFAPNQFGKNNRVLRRPVCRECYAKKTKADPQLKRAFELSNPRPLIGEQFHCPICDRRFIREHNNDVVIDHSHADGSIRGWLCSSCNTSLGKFNDDPEVLQRAIDWITRERE
jgi:hypothetical protein